VVDSRGAVRLKSENSGQEIKFDFAMPFPPRSAGFVVKRRGGGVMFGLADRLEGAVGFDQLGIR
jgi:hypothetical protein